MILFGFQVSVQLILLSAIVGFVSYYIWSRKRALSLWKRLGIPGPEPDFWMGNAKQMLYGRVNTMGVLENWRDQYGRVFGYYIGLRPSLNIIDADIVKEVFVKQFSNFINRPDALRYEQNLARLRDNDWKEIRRIMNPVFTTKKLKTLAHMMNDAENVLLEVLEEKTKTNEQIPAYKTSQALSFQIITKTAFAMDVDCQRNENLTFYDNMKAWLNYPYNPLAFFILMFPGLQSFFRFFLRFDKRYRFWDEIDGHIRSIIGHRRRTPEINGKGDLLGLMLEAAEGKNEVSTELTNNILKEPDESENVKETPKPRLGFVHKTGRYLMTDTQMVDNLILFLMAGFDSTSNTIAFALHFLAKNPDIQQRAYDEIISGIGDLDVITAEDCKKLAYIEQIVYETLRLFPPIPIFLHRECKETVTIKGVTIPKGAVVECPPWLLHRDPEYWPDPEKFDPDRFAPENRTEVQNYAFVPWGIGPRMCIGARFALIEATTALAKVIREYRIVPSSDFKTELKIQVKNILLNPAEEIYINVIRR